MLDNTTKSNVIVNWSMMIGVYLIFWIVVTIILPTISLGLKLFLKKSKTIDDHSPKTLQES